MAGERRGRIRAADIATVRERSRIDEVVGPTRLRPAKNSVIAPTVEIPARQSSHHQPASVSSPGRNWPSATVDTVSAAAAPVHTSVASSCGGIRLATPSLTRMYAL